MRKSILLFLAALVAGQITLFGATISQQSAQTIALNYFKVNNPNTRGTVSANLKYTQTENDGTIDFYVFDIVPAKSFVIIAADDNIIPILGHSEEGYFNPNFKTQPLNHWVHKTSANIYKAIQQHVQADARIKGLWAAYSRGQKPGSPKSTTVQAMCTTTWDQENDFTNPPPYLYNLYCPWNDTDQQRCLTGCVATAQAQVMKYWNYPATGTGSFSYDDIAADGYSDNYGVQSSNFASHTYKWKIMPPELTGLEPANQDTAVDVLMYDCAVSVGMDFGDDNEDGSGANALLAEELQYGDSNCSQHALVKYFSYNADSINGVFESNYTAATWTALIEHEMDMGRPVMYEGDDATQGGHCWVCDGYDADNNLHMNWGWSGFDNGYFAINNLTTAGNFNPILQDDALIGIVPKYPLAPITNFAANTTSSCNGVVQFMDFSQELPTSWLWNFGDGSTSTSQNPVHTYTASGTYTVTLTATNPAGSTPLTLTNYVTVNLLQAPTVNNVSSNTPTSFNLSVSTTDAVNWYSAQGVYLSSANPFATPVIDTTTTYYVEDSAINPAYHVGPQSNNIGGGHYETDPWALQFNVNKSCIIVSVYVYADSAANRNIQVLDSGFNVVAQQTVYCPAGGSRAVVNLAVNAGGPYYMQLGDTMGLYNDTTGANYPYTDSAGIVSITGNTTYDPAYYYYFYDWEVKEPDCTSPRVPVTASITTGIIGIGGKIDFTLYPNPANNDIVLETNEAGNGVTLSVKNMLGQTLVNRTLDETQTHINLSGFANGIYLVQLSQGDKTGVQKLVVSK